MTKLIYQYFFRGLITALPLGLTVYLLYMFLRWSESVSMQAIRPFIGKFYVPGMGLLLGVTLILLLGFVVSQRGAGKLLSLVELPFTNLPVVKSIYSSLKNFADYFSPQRSKSAQQMVVILKMPGQDVEIVGLITRQHVDDLPAGFLQGDRVAVYLPMGYMIGGYTVFVPRDWTQPIDMSVEDAMRASMFAWMSAAGSDDSPSPTKSRSDSATS
ncbi:MAG: DUF502 domain-containing protein [Gammaproteobacteria bacterium]|nr:DUF502 domain-containing protein [Sideroxydans sp.]MBU4046122.1 DUF502 domain-containing protein [Gammaproteobacteria bacterium]MBU4150708.1 DUF502 domain-containing protein [Gammaproteobacteria bacterium]